MIRQPAVADSFYPGDPTSLARIVAGLMPTGKPALAKSRALAAISPHAGYIYSGSVAAETLSCVQIPETVVVLGLNHHGKGSPLAVSKGTWAMPMGDVTCHDHLAEQLLSSNSSPFQHDELAHVYEHSVEVQVPILQALQPKLTIVPVVLSHISYDMCKLAGEVLADVVRSYDKDVLIVASSDMSHYESRETASAKDARALSQIKSLNPQGLYDTVHDERISMCGVIPVTVALITANLLGATKSQLIRYTDSGEVSGDLDKVVGYAGVVVV